MTDSVAQVWNPDCERKGWHVGCVRLCASALEPLQRPVLESSMSILSSADWVEDAECMLSACWQVYREGAEWHLAALLPLDGAMSLGDVHCAMLYDTWLGVLDVLRRP
jgi:hypothetical protein